MCELSCYGCKKTIAILVEFAAGPDVEMNDTVNEGTEQSETGQSGATMASAAPTAEIEATETSAGNFLYITCTRVSPNQNLFFQDHVQGLSQRQGVPGRRQKKQQAHRRWHQFQRQK
jgi:hypothetical protein